MNRLERILSRWNFKKIAVGYLILALVAGLACTVTVGVLYRERLSFAWQYARLEKAGDEAAQQTAADRTAAASADVVDVLIIDREQQVVYSAKGSAFAAGALTFTKAGDTGKYLISPAHPDAVFQYTKSEEFMLRSIVSKDFGKIRTDYEEDNAFETNLSSRTLYMLSRVRIHGSDRLFCVITRPTAVPGGMLALKITAALGMLFFCIYWVLLALWMYRDAAGRRLSPLYWGLIGLLTNLVGLMVYQIYKRSMALCPSCGAAQNAEYLYCSFCGTPLGQRCGDCGCKVGPKDSFCHRCGHKL